MTRISTLIAILTMALLLMAGGTSCGGAAALADQLAQAGGIGAISDDGTADQGRGDNGVVTPGDDDGTADQGQGDNGVVTPGDDDGTADQGRGDRNDDNGGSGRG